MSTGQQLGKFNADLKLKEVKSKEKSSAAVQTWFTREKFFGILGRAYYISSVVLCRAQVGRKATGEFKRALEKDFWRIGLRK